MTLHYSDESKSPRPCDQCGDDGEEPSVHCQWCNGTGTLNADAKPDLLVNEPSKYYPDTFEPGFYWMPLRDDGAHSRGPFKSEAEALANARETLK